ncbi:MAG TPA: nucleotidyltransferase family protein [Pyrinomonadaceae bacterium]|jgi:hypothetical protein
MAVANAQSKGRLLAATLAGSWRGSPPKLDCSLSELEEIAPLLLRSGAAALCWRRARDSGLRDAPAAREFHQAYRQNFLQAALRERTIEKVFGLLRAAGVEPILVKGWAAARLYTERGLRPCGDVDLCVRLDQFEPAEAALWEALAYGRYEVDLHRGFDGLGGGDADAIYARSRLLKLGATAVRVLGREDELRALSVHMLREGAWRPLWMCDVAAAVEAAGASFDWGCCLTEDRRLAGWINCAIRAAHELLGADITGTPAARMTKPLPRWLVPTILKEWASRRPSMPERHRAPMAYLRSPAGILKGLRHRWPNTIEATVVVRGPFNDWPRLPFQLGSCVARTVKLAARWPKARKGR